MKPSATLDHLVIAARTLEEGREWLEARLGVAGLNVTLQPGGEHDLFGTHNLLLGLGPKAYLEVIAVNPAAPTPTRPRWFGLDTPEMTQRLTAGPALIHWVARSPLPSLLAPPLDAVAPDVLSLSRGANRWRLTVPPDGSLPLGGVMPSLIDWQTPPPPTRLPESGVRLARLHLGTPQPQVLRQALADLNFEGTELEIVPAQQAELRATLVGTDTAGSRRRVEV